MERRGVALLVRPFMWMGSFLLVEDVMGEEEEEEEEDKTAYE